jgi:DNA-binding MarR family transcriptional regulator
MTPRGERPTVAAAPDAEQTFDRFFTGLALKRAQHELRLALNAELLPLATTISQLNVLREIRRNPGVSSVELARLGFLTPQSLGQQVAQMQERGLVERRPGQGRKLCHYITDGGEWLFHEGMERARACFEHVMQDFTEDDLVSLTEILQCIETRATEVRTRSKRLHVVDGDCD